MTRERHKKKLEGRGNAKKSKRKKKPGRQKDRVLENQESQEDQ